MKQTQRYLSYLLRLWQSGQGQQAAWQASLEYPMTGERRSFASLQEVFAFLETEMQTQNPETDTDQISK